MPKELIIGINQKGNLLELALTSNFDKNTHGDDWDDKPYDINAGEVYQEYVSKYQIVYVPFNKTVYTYSNYHNLTHVNLSMLDLLHKKEPILYIVNDNDFQICDKIYLTDDLKDHPVFKKI